MTTRDAGEPDWRLDLGPENVFDATLVKKRYRAWSESWDHDHCIYCTAKFTDPQYSHSPAVLIEQSPEILTIGFVIESDGGEESRRDDYYWICETCTHDFRSRFRWSIVTAEPLPEATTKPSAEQ